MEKLLEIQDQLTSDKDELDDEHEAAVDPTKQGEVAESNKSKDKPSSAT